MIQGATAVVPIAMGVCTTFRIKALEVGAGCECPELPDFNVINLNNSVDFNPYHFDWVLLNFIQMSFTLLCYSCGYHQKENRSSSGKIENINVR